MGRHGSQASAASRTVQKWQVASNRNESVADMPSEDEHGGSTRMPSSGGASPSASSAELGRQTTFTDNSKKTAAEIQKEKDDRARWADVESDGEDRDVEVSKGGYRNSAGDSWETRGKKSKGAKPTTKARIGKMDLPPPCPPPNEAPRQVRQAEKESYRPPKQADPPRSERPSNAYLDSCYESSKRAEYSNTSWDDASWGSAARGGGQSWSSSKRGGGGGAAWEESSWSKPEPVRPAKAEPSRKDKGRGGGGGGSGGGSGGGFDSFKGGKNESFKSGPHVTTNMDKSRLAW